jgi:hypothetical protein
MIIMKISGDAWRLAGTFGWYRENEAGGLFLRKWITGTREIGWV